MKMEPIQFIPEQFTPMHLLRLVEAVQDIASEQFTIAIAESLRLINHPPIIVKPNEYSVEKEK